jgi:hypothetical protein
MFKSLLGGIFGGISARRQNKFNAAQADKQMAFQERMSNTAYQRAMTDMKAAGLNPMLAAMKGGATTPSGAAAKSADIASSINTGINSAATISTMKRTKKTNDLIHKTPILQKIDAMRSVGINPTAMINTGFGGMYVANEMRKMLGGKGKKMSFPSLPNTAKTVTMDSKGRINTPKSLFPTAAKSLGTTLGLALLQGSYNQIPKYKSRSKADKVAYKKSYRFNYGMIPPGIN